MFKVKQQQRNHQSYDKNRIEILQIRVTAAEKREIQQLANLQHLSVSSLVRWLILAKYKNDLIIDNQ